MRASFQLTIAGTTNDEIVDVVVDNQLVQTFANVGGDADSRQFVSYVFETPEDDFSAIQIHLINDGVVDGVDRAVRIHSIASEGERFRANDPDVFFGAQVESDDCRTGSAHGQLLECNGFFEFQFDVDPQPIDGVLRSAVIDDQYARFNFPTLENPVIIAGPPTNADSSPGVVQLRNVTDTSVDLRFKEWNYLDFDHGEEAIDWLAISEGSYTTADGSRWEVGTFDLELLNEFRTIEFDTSFDTAPELFLTVQTQNAAPVLVRARNISSDSFDASLFEEELTFGSGHIVEKVGYLAIQPGASSGAVNIGGVDVPYLFETAAVGTTSQNIAGFAVQLEEEQSFDEETGHARETVNALALGRRYFAQIIDIRGLDPVVLRQTTVQTELSLPAGFELEEVASDSFFSVAVAVEIDGEGRQFLADARGVVWEVIDGERSDTPFLDIRDDVSNVNFGEGQLTGFKLDPDFVNNGHFYVLYTTTVDGESFGRLTRFTQSATDPGVADESSARHLLGQTADSGLLAADFHSLGDIEFGEDGSLLVSWGDSASNSPDDPAHFNSQDLNTAAGKIFRINAATGRGFATNPFFDGDFDSTQSKVWAYGIRNGYRFTVEPGSGRAGIQYGDPGRILLGDVGRDRFEELNIVSRGDNLGWPFFEGTLPFRDGLQDETLVGPALAFAHPTARSVTGGVFIQGDNYPEEYQGKYLIADFVLGWIKAIEVHEDGTVEATDFATGIQGISDMFLSLIHI